MSEFQSQPMPCPHCQRVPEPFQGKGIMAGYWAIFCDCTVTRDIQGRILFIDDEGEGTIGDSEEEAIERWNELVEEIITGT